MRYYNKIHYIIYFTILYVYSYVYIFTLSPYIDIKPENILVGYHQPLPSKLMVESILEYSNKKYNSSNKTTGTESLHMSVHTPVPVHVPVHVPIYDEGGTMVKKGKKKRAKKKVSAPIHNSDHHPTATTTQSTATHSHIASSNTHTNHTNTNNNKASPPSHSRASRGDRSTQSSLSPLKTGGHNSDPHIHASESSRSPKKHKKKRKKKKPVLSLPIPILDINSSVLPVYSSNSSSNIDFNTSSYTLTSPSCRREMIRMEQDEGQNYDHKNKGQNYDESIESIAKQVDETLHIQPYYDNKHKLISPHTSPAPLRVDASYKPLPTFLAFLNFDLTPTTTTNASNTTINTATSTAKVYNKQAYREPKEVDDMMPTNGVYCDHRVIDREEARGQNYEGFVKSGESKEAAGSGSELTSIPMVRSLPVWLILSILYYTILY